MPSSTHSSITALCVMTLILMVGACGGDASPSAAKGNKDHVSPYASWPNGPDTDAADFPVGVWLQSPSNAEAYRQIGVNLYVGLWKGPTQAQLDALTAAGMQTICALNDVGRQNLNNSTIVAWMHGDEPDNAQANPEGGWGGAVPLASIQSDYDSLRTVDPSRPIWLNLGQGVDSLRVWGGEEAIVWNVIETTRINSDHGPTPQQVRTEVWMSIIHGSQGIVYFAHEWNPVFREARLLEDEAMRQGVSAINEQIHRLAPILNAGSDNVEVSVVSSDPQVPVDVMVREVDGELYVFAVGMRLASTSATFSIDGAKLSRVTVVDEDRTLAV